MTSSERRKFLQLSALMVGTSSLAACGGGGGAETDVKVPDAASPPDAGATPPSPPPPPPPPPPPAPPPPPPAVGLGVATGAMQLTLSTSVASTVVPYSVGYAFRRGDVPSGQTVVSDNGTLQVTPKNYWTDGSLKFAVLAGRASLPANKPIVITFRKATPAAAGAALTLVNLKNTGIVAQIATDAFGTAGWIGADWDNFFQAWVSGPEMSSWIYRKPVGTDAHLVAWLEVRLFSSGAVEVLPWVENGYLRVAAPTNKKAIYSFTLGGTQRFSASIDLKHHTRTPLVSGQLLSHWLATSPDVAVRHDALYLQASELVPAYRGHVQATASAAQSLVSTFAPLQQGNFNYDNDNMPSSGYQEPIGLLPQHDVLYLTCDGVDVYSSVVRNGYSAGRWGIHYRDETTQRPLRFSQYPALVLADSSGVYSSGASTQSQYTPPVSGGNPPTWDLAHSPSVGYLAYLITGRWYFMEEVQFAATVNYLLVTDTFRLQSKAVLKPVGGAVQTRSAAWGFRTLAQALMVTPDSGDPLRTEFVTAVQNNIDYYHGTYVAKPNNAFGFINPGEEYRPPADREVISIWQQDFHTAAWGFGLALDLPVAVASKTKMQDFFAWKARSVVGRLGTSTGFWYVNGTPYTIAASPAVFGDYEGGTGPWYADWAAIYAATYSTVPTWFSTTEGVLASEIMPGGTAYWGNLQPALAYAVRHGVPGALAAYNRMTGASNWAALRDGFNIAPVWGVMPTSAQPTWLKGKNLNEWFEIPGTAGAGGAAVDAFSGMAMNDQAAEIFIAAAGGHNDSADNRVVSLRLADDSPSWRLRLAASTAVTPDVAYYSDGRPASRHLYSTAHYIPQNNRVMLFGVRFAYGSAHTFQAVDGFNLDTNSWDAAGTWKDTPAGHYGTCVIPQLGEVHSYYFGRWKAATNTWDQPVPPDVKRWPMTYDPTRRQLFALQWGDGECCGTPTVAATKIPLGGSTQIPVTFNASAALDQFKTDGPTYAAMDYDPINDQFLFYCGQGSGAGRIYVVKAGDGAIWDMSILPLGSGSITPAAVSNAGVHNRFRYVPALRGFVLLAGSTKNLYFIRTA